jgi:hypothetical protein
MVEALSPEAHQSLKEQALMNLCDMVKAEETQMQTEEAARQVQSLNVP